MFTTRMIRLFAVVLGRDVEKVTEVLLREGVMQFINISRAEDAALEQLDEVNIQSFLTEISELRKRIEGFLHPVGIYPDPPEELDLNNRVSVDIKEEMKKLDKLAVERERIRERQRVVQQEVLKLEDIKRQVAMYGLGISDVALSSQHSFISIQIGKIPTTNMNHLQDAIHDIPSVVLPIDEDKERTHLLVISMKRDTRRVEDILKNVGWTSVELPQEVSSFKADISEDLSSKLSLLISEQKKLNDDADELITKESERLKQLWINLRVNELMYRIQSYFMHSSRTMIFSGWLPSSKKDLITKKIIQASEGRCYLEWHEAKKVLADKQEPPVQFHNPKVFAPFQMLVSNFGIPEYGTIDPTPFVMPIYMIMFGLMFGDAGQGVILATLGFLGAFFFKKKQKKETFINLSHLIFWCGLSSILFGILFGSYFGMAWFKPLWFDFHGIVSGHSQEGALIQDVYDILEITIFFGITVIFIGLVFNWINLFSKRKWLELIFDKGGIMGGWIYMGGIYIAYYMVSHGYKGLPGSNILFPLVGLPALLLFVKEPLHFMKHRKEGAAEKFTFLTPLNFAMEWIVELLEIFSGYLSNTLSFMRVAGLGIAHVCLMMSFFTLADMFGGKGVVPLLVLIAGNILVIGLEGLSAGIQALRLNYYEFFTKFFHGTGKLYSPVSLSSRD